MTNQTAATRAPKGGISIMGVFYKGGQFLPSYEPQNGKFNSKRKSAKKISKQEIALYTWEAPARIGMRSIWAQLSGTIAKYNHDTKQLEYIADETILKYRGMPEVVARDLISMWNKGERWQG